jgi:polysaccharide biosynthesis transport protein
MRLSPVIIIKAILKKFYLVLLFPITVAGVVAYMQLQKPREFQSGMVFYTGITSGYNLSSQDEVRVDNIAVHNAFDNLITILESRETLEEVAMRLLTTHLLLEESDPFVVSSQNLDRLHHELLPRQLIEELVAGSQFDLTLDRVHAKYRESKSNPIIHLLNTSSTFYNVDNIRKALSASRKRNSDMLEVIYRSSDPGVCLLTLQILSDAFIEKNITLRNYETGGIIAYFLSELEKARTRLNLAEEALRDYSQENQVINYNEQTKYMAAAKEDLERDINMEQANIVSNRQALVKLESNLGDREKLYLNSRDIISKRNEIARIHGRIVAMEILQAPQDNEHLDVLKDQLAGLEDDLYNLTGEYKSLQYSTETLPRESLLNQWLIHAIDYDKSIERIEVLKGQRDYFDNLFDQFAPIGFNLSKMEREIQIAEREYLSILHGLNLAKLRQSNLELFGTLEILDIPFFPLNPRGTKTKMMVIGAFLASLFFVVGIIAGLEFLDRSMRTPALAEAYTGLDPLGALAGTIRTRKVDTRQLNEQLHYLMCNKLALSLSGSSFDNRPLIFVYSTRMQAGIVHAGMAVAQALKGVFGKVVYMHCQGTAEPVLADMEKVESLDVITYDDTPGGVEEMIRFLDADHHPAVIQLPEFERQSLAGFFRLKPVMCALVVAGWQTWEYQDKQMLKGIMDSFPGALHKVLVSDMMPDFLDDFLAEVPRKRSFLRRWVKKMLRLNF